MATNGDTASAEVTSEVKTTVTSKKQAKKQSKTEEVHKESKNGNTDTEADLTVQLPSKKSAAKTETKVEVVKKILPDGAVEEVKTTTTRTTIDGRTEIKTKTETTITPKETEEEVEEEEEEEYEEETENADVEVEEVNTNGQDTEDTQPTSITEGSSEVNKDTVIANEERSETTTTKKVVVSLTENNGTEEITEAEHIEEVEQEIEEEEEPEPEEEETNQTTPQKPVIETQESVEVEEIEELEEEEEVEDVAEENINDNPEENSENNKETEKVESKVDEKVVEEVEEDEEEEVEEEIEENIPKQEITEVTTEEFTEANKEDAIVDEEEEYEEAEEEATTVETKTETNISDKKEVQETIVQTETTEETVEKSTTEVPAVEKSSVEVPAVEKEVESEPIREEATPAPEPKTTTREIPILFDKVEDIEIKPIGPASEAISRTRTESTEITTSNSLGGPISTQTELHRVENIVVQNRITKTLDQSYEQLTQQGLPTVKTYFPPTREPVSPLLPPAKPYLSSYTDPNQQRHSLLLDRLSVDRQLPQPEQYQIFNESTYDAQNQYQEPQSEVLTVSNVKPSMITNQEWYQQHKENVIYNNVTPTTPKPSPAWNQPPQPQYQPQPATPSQPQYQAPKPQYQAPIEPPYQAPSQPQYQPPSQPLYRAPSEPRAQVPQYEPSYKTPTPLPHYQTPQQPTPSPQTYNDSYTSNYSTSTKSYQQNSYPSYTPTPSNWGTSSLNNDLSALNTQPNLYSSSFSNKESTDTTTHQQNTFSSSYVPPPWEQDSTYIPDTTQYYPPPQQTPTQNTVPSWKPTPPQGKFTKPPPTAYVPPAPNQSFVKPVTKSETPRVAGRKTYYSEYERRYISVPESTYVPAETKYQPQPDPSPQYYYDNDEAAEKEEHAWRKELREFTEKSSQTQYTTDQSVRPPWEEEKVYPKEPTATPAYTPTPTWSQTLRPRSGRERTFESDYGSQEWPKTNTIGRGRPLSTYAQSNVTRKVERTRGVSVDRYNPNSYKSPTPMEHSPVHSHTLTPTTAPPPKFHANPNVPAYHSSRASAEPREQPASYQNPRSWGDSRASPIQSRSFKYLQWITGTDE